MAYVNFDATTEPQGQLETKAWGFLLKGRNDHDGFAAMMRLLKVLFGLSAATSALTLWVVPGSDFSLDLLAMKGAVTVVLLMTAFALFRSGRVEAEPEVHVDIVQREVRVLDVFGSQEVIKHRYAFDELGGMHIEDHALHLFTEEGDRIAVLDLDPETEARLTR